MVYLVSFSKGRHRFPWCKWFTIGHGCYGQSWGESPTWNPIHLSCNDGRDVPRESRVDERKKNDPKQLLRLKGKLLLLKMRGWTKHVLRGFFFVSPVKGILKPGSLEIVGLHGVGINFWRIPEVLGGEKLVVYSLIFQGDGVKYVWCFFTPVSGEALRFDDYFWRCVEATN